MVLVDNKKLKLSFYNEYFLFASVILIVACSLFAWFCCCSYYLHEKETKEELLKSKKIISLELTETFKENEHILRFFGSKIADQINYKDLNSVASLLISSVYLNIKSMTESYICWANANGQVVVSGKHGVLRKDFPNIINRSYFISARQNPWTLQIAEPDQSVFSGNDILPLAMGIKNKQGKFIGYLLIGLKPKYITQAIKEIVNTEKTNYILFYQNFRAIISSESSKNIENFINAEQLMTVKSTKQEILSAPFYLNNIKYSYLTRVPGYPIFILTGYNINLYRQNFLSKVSVRLVEFLFIGGGGLVLLYFFRRKIVSPITELSELAFLISKGDLNVKIPKQHSIELFRLAKGLALVIKYIRKTELYKQKLEIANSVARDSDFAKENFTKKMHYEFGSYFKEIFVYSSMIHKYLKNNLNVNNQIVQYSQKIQELVKLVHSKTSNILELSVFDLNVILEQAIQINMKKSFSKEIEIISNLQSNIPNIYADELRIKQIVISLIRQSVENSPKNSEIWVTSSVYLENGCTWFKIVIMDQSFGLSEQDLNEIEEKFNVNMVGETIFEFTNMKIEFIEKLVLMHKGTLHIVDKLYNGRTIQILLPLLKLEEFVKSTEVVYISDKIKVV